LREMKQNMKNPARYKSTEGYASISPQDLQMLPSNMDLDIDANIGDNSNQSLGQKLLQLSQLLPQMAQSPTSEAYVNPLASYNLALDILKNMGMDPTRFLNDPDSQEFQQAQQQAQQMAQQKQQEAEQAEKENMQLELGTKSANISLIKAEADNKKIDNKRQLLQAADDSNKEWAELKIKAEGTEGAALPKQTPVDFMSLYQDTEKEDEIEEQQEQMMQQQMMQQQGQQQMPQ